MSAALHQFAASLRLHFRNRMALIYSYIFPTIFLIAFWVLYRHEQVPLALHLGELLTVTILGGACFGLPTTLVSERERGVWRRYRLAPVPTGTLVASTVASRYVLLLIAGVLQIGLALAIGMPLPRHPLQLWLAFTAVALAFLGLGLLIASLADTVPAVQALGQCIFLPMLILGGIAVPLASLPEWAQQLARFFPGRYAVDAIQAATTGEGLGAHGFDLLALVVIGGASLTAGARLFRWDAQQRFAAVEGKGWAAVALLAWVVVGVSALALERPVSSRPVSLAGVTRPGNQAGGSTSPAEATSPLPSAAPIPPQTPPAEPTVTSPNSGGAAPRSPGGEAAGSSAAAAPAGEPGSPRASATPAARPAPVPALPAAASGGTPAAGDAAPPATSKPAAAEPPSSPSPSATAAPGPPREAPPDKPPTVGTAARWQDVTRADVDRDLVFDRLPPDSGVVAPIAPVEEDPGPDLNDELSMIRSRLPTWGPAQVPDPVQRVRNVLYVAAVPDVFQIPLERYLPHVVYERLLADFPREELIKILYWIALHPEDGDEAAMDQLQDLGMSNGPADISQARERAAYYGVKLLGRLVGKIGG